MFVPERNAGVLNRVKAAILIVATVTVLLVSARSGRAQSLSMIGGAPAAHMAQERQQLAAEERQKKMLNDADQLIVLAQKLKVSVDKSNKDTLSIDVIREAERIEKLAKQVRETMRQ